MVFIVICEAEADFRTATELAVRVVREHVPWLDEEHVPHQFQWVGRDPDSPFWLWREIDNRARLARIRAQGHFDGEPGQADAQTTRRALLFLRSLFENEAAIDGILLIRDDDGDRSRRVGLEMGRNSAKDLADRIVIGLAHLKRECWVLHGFLPANDREQVLLAEACRDLTLDPTREPHRRDGETRSAKGVLARLTDDNYEREAACWREADLKVLRERGESSGLAAYLTEVEDRLVPRFTGRPFERSAV